MTQRNWLHGGGEQWKEGKDRQLSQARVEMSQS